jgi:formamidopyrimidine-DNA glycosylase
MPELPDVETFRRRLKGRRVRSSDRRGKVLFVNIDPVGALAMHFGTNGSLDFAALVWWRVRQSILPRRGLVRMHSTRNLTWIGNIYADEILFQAGIYPGVGREWSGQKHHRNPVRRSGTCFALRWRPPPALEAGSSACRRAFSCPSAILARCPRCPTLLAVDKRGGRSVYYCPDCQPAPRRRQL